MLAGAREQVAIFEGLLWLGVIVVAMMVAFTVAVFVRKRTKAAARHPPEFTLEQLRDLRDRGELTIPQYEALKQRVLNRPGGYGA